MPFAYGRICFNGYDEKRGIKDKFYIASAATSTEEIWGGKGNTIRIIGCDTDNKIKLLLDYAIDESMHGRSIADPWYSGDFTATWNDVVAGCEGFLKYIENV